MNTIRSLRGLLGCLVMLLLAFHPLLATSAEGQGHRKKRAIGAWKANHAAERSTTQELEQDEEDDADTGGNEDEDDRDDVEEEEADKGPWKVTVPKALRREGVGLVLRGRHVPLDRQSMRLSGRDLPEFVSLIGLGGRVLERRKMLVTQHLLTGFHERRFRVSGAWGVSALEGTPVRGKDLPRAMVESGFEGLYQPSALGLVVGLHASSGLIEQEQGGKSNDEVRVRASELRIGAAWEFGLAPRSSYYRWHGLVQGGVLLGGATRERSSAGKDERASDTEAHADEDEGAEAAWSSSGVYAAFDAIHLWQNWWWGGRLLLKKQSLSSDDDDDDNGSGEVTSHGLQIVGSYTW
jgi:hypothetical protein